MNVLPRIIYLFLLVVLLGGCQKLYQERANTPKDKVKVLYQNDINLFQISVNELERVIETDSSEKIIQNAFLSSRINYKKIESLTEYYYAATAKSINGPALEEVEEEDPLRIPIPPEGLQVIEEYLFPTFNPSSKKEALYQVKVLKSNIGRLVKVAETNELTETHIFDALRLQIVRILSLGITGFDSPIANHSIPEATSSLLSIQSYLNCFTNKKEKKEFKVLKEKIASTVNYLKDTKNFNSLDRLEFIKNYLNPISTNLYTLQLALNIPYSKDLKAFSSNAYTVFDKDAFNANYFAPNKNSYSSPEKIQLGKILFFDPIISGNNQRSCASCHDPKKGFSDGLNRSIAFNFKGKVNRNAPTILNAGLQSALFQDGRVMFLEDQANEVLANENEMHGSMAVAAQNIQQSEDYIKAFKAAFPKDAPYISEKNIKIALACYTRSLMSFNSRFDKYIRGDENTLVEDEIKGFNLFAGKAKCATCHFLPMFNGVVPPTFENTEAEVIGVPSTKDTMNATIDPDLGKYNIRQIEKYSHAFKTPTLRNVALTAPYMHNGVFSTLAEVVDFYNHGGGKGIGISLSNQTLPEEKLNLTLQEKDQLIAFMKALTDTTGLTSIPKKLPRFNQAKLNSRQIGGIY